ncbi:hypothetical protein BV911_03125 [Pseudoruegeria sp. SK021]|nr:hypothetical protein BV911_03125 [Pseudoruegeria sp. SK021]
MIAGLDAATIIAALVAVALSGLAKGGFAGVGMLATPVLAMVMSPVQAASILLPILALQDLVSITSYRRAVAWPVVWKLVPGAALGILTGYLFAASLPQAFMALALGVISVVFGTRGFVRSSRDTGPGKAGSRVGGIIFGFISGLTSMIAHAGAPPFQMYVLPQKLSKDLFIGTTIIFFAMMNYTKIIPYIVLGQLDLSTLWASALLAPWAVASGLAGLWIVRRVNPKTFEKVIFGLLVAVGLKLIVDGLIGMALF